MHCGQISQLTQGSFSVPQELALDAYDALEMQ